MRLSLKRLRLHDVLLAVLLLRVPVLSARAQSKSPILALTHVTVIDATGAPPKRDMTVVVSDGRISSIVRTSRRATPRNAVVVDATGKFLVPGLWDMHAHLLTDWEY